MTKDIYLLGSTGSIGDTTLKILKKDKNNFKVKLLTTYSNVNKLYKQAIQFKVKNVVIFNKEKYLKNYKKFKLKKINVFSSIDEVFKTNNKKSYITINAISGIDGLEPTLNIIKYSHNLAIANNSKASLYNPTVVINTFGFNFIDSNLILLELSTKDPLLV